jgi:hypothetical protein
MRIVGIGGAVIKTAWEEIKEVARQGMIDVLIHNGGSLFHDFQRATDKTLQEIDAHSWPLHDLLENMDVDREASLLVWSWVKTKGDTPEGSLTRIMEDQGKMVLMFTTPGADFWHLFSEDWSIMAHQMLRGFNYLYSVMMKDKFHFICMGSAVIMPEVFTKALAIAKPKEFRADVVDFLEMYRPRTRIAGYGHYYRMTHKKYLDLVLTRNLWSEPLTRRNENGNRTQDI